jgi:hypothetical protein
VKEWHSLGFGKPEFPEPLSENMKRAFEIKKFHPARPRKARVKETNDRIIAASRKMRRFLFIYRFTAL